MLEALPAFLEVGRGIKEYDEGQSNASAEASSDPALSCPETGGGSPIDKLPTVQVDDMKQQARISITICRRMIQKEKKKDK